MILHIVEHFEGKKFDSSARSPAKEEKGRKKPHDLTRRVTMLLSIERNKKVTSNPLGHTLLHSRSKELRT